jgi:hypothetical protein
LKLFKKTFFNKNNEQYGLSYSDADQERYMLNKVTKLLENTQFKEFVIASLPDDLEHNNQTIITEFHENIGTIDSQKNISKAQTEAYLIQIFGTIDYINSGNKVPDTDGAKPCLDLPSEFPSDVNYEWYVEKCITMLYEMGYLKRQEQIKFW